MREDDAFISIPVQNWFKEQKLLIDSAIEKLLKQKMYIEEKQMQQIESLQKKKIAIRGDIKALDTQIAAIQENLDILNKARLWMALLLFFMIISAAVAKGFEVKYVKDIEEVDIQHKQEKQQKKEIKKKISSIKSQHIQGEFYQLRGKFQDLQGKFQKILTASKHHLRREIVSIP